MKNLYFLVLFIAFTGFVLGQEEIPLDPCPSSPNCVQTYGEKARKNMAVLSFKGDLETSRQKLKELVLAMEGTSLSEENPNYLHFEFSTSIGDFIDDVEFYFDDSTKSIHFRSASRKGYGDFGANKRRMKRISKKWEVTQ